MHSTLRRYNLFSPAPMNIALSTQILLVEQKIVFLNETMTVSYHGLYQVRNAHRSFNVQLVLIYPQAMVRSPYLFITY